MKKISIILAVITLPFVFFVLLYRGTLIINPASKPANITIDGKVYKNKDYLSLKLRVGYHKVKVEKEDFTPYNETIKIGFLEKKEITPFVEEAKDKEEIKKIAKNFIEAWYTYTTQVSKEYLEKIKPYMTKDFYEATYYVNTSRPQDFIGETPLKTEVVSVKISSYSNNEAEAVINRKTTETLNKKTYERNEEIKLVKENNNWLVSYLK